MTPLGRSTLRVLGGLLLALAAGWLLSGCVLPTDLTVNSTVDAGDADPGDGVCETATPDECTLRAAVQEANALDTPVTVHLEPGATYTVIGAAVDDDVAAVGDLDITGDITIEGEGATLRPGNDKRVLDNFGTMALFDLTVQGTFADGSLDGVRNAGNAYLGEVLVTGFGTVTQSGGSIVVTADGAVVQEAGTLRLERSRISGNAPGGLATTGGTTLVVDSSIVYNASLQFGGGAAIWQQDGDLLVVGSTVGATWFSGPGACLPPTVCPLEASGSGLLQTGGSAVLVRSALVQNRRSIVSDGDVKLIGTAVGRTVLGNCTGAITSLGYNLDEDGTCLDGTVSTDLPPTPGALPLVPTALTGFLVPPAGSPLLDVVPDGTAHLCWATKPTDQRGAPQPVNGACDIGPVERQPTDP